MTKAETVFEKEATLRQKAIAGTLGTLLSVTPAVGQLKWLARKAASPLVNALTESHAMPALDTTKTSIGRGWISKSHPSFHEYTKELREGMENPDLNFGGFHVDTARAGKRKFINAFGTDEKGNITHRLFRNEAGPKDREQWVDEVSQNAANEFLKQREPKKKLLATK